METDRYHSRSPRTAPCFVPRFACPPPQTVVKSTSFNHLTVSLLEMVTGFEKDTKVPGAYVNAGTTFDHRVVTMFNIGKIGSW